MIVLGLCSIFMAVKEATATLVLHVVYFEPPSKFINYPGFSFSSTFQDLKLSFPGLSRTKLIFQTFHGLENPGKNPRLSRMRGNPAQSNSHNDHVLLETCWLGRKDSTVKYH